MGYIGKDHKWHKEKAPLVGGVPTPNERRRIPTLAELGETGVFLDIVLDGKTDENGVTPILVKSIEHSATGTTRILNIPGSIVCDGDYFYYLHKVEDFQLYGFTTYTAYPDDGQPVKYWELMKEEPTYWIMLKDCSLEIDVPIRGFYLWEVQPNWRHYLDRN